MEWVAKRFYSSASTTLDQGGFLILLDGRPVRTPAGSHLCLPASALAVAIAEEWSAQTDAIRPQTMPLTRLAATAIDRVAVARAAVIDDLVRYGGSDLVCYRAEAPADLVLRQHQCWKPLVDWIEAAYGVRLAVTAGIMPIEQSEDALLALRQAFDGHSGLALSAVALAVQTSGSAVLGLALANGQLDAASAFRAAELDASYQIERWGEDAEATERRRRLRDDLSCAARFLALLGRTESRGRPRGQDHKDNGAAQ